MVIRKYNDSAASPAHAGTIRAHTVIPKGSVIEPPFDSAWGYLGGPGRLETHSHTAAEIYIIFRGSGRVHVDGEFAEVGCGDIVEIPSGAPHDIENLTDGELLWLAFWWKENV